MWDNLKELVPYFPKEITWEAMIFKLISVFVISIVSSSAIYYINKSLKDIRGKDVLGLSEKATVFKWVSGAVLTTLLLYGFQIISFKIHAIVVVAFVWDKFFEKMYNSAQSEASKDQKAMDDISPEAIEDIH